MTLSSAAPVLALLDESSLELKAAALKSLDTVVDTHWSEIATRITDIETLVEDESFSGAGLAASVASRVFYHLEELDDALKFALEAGEHFRVQDTSEYAQTLVATCIDKYTQSRRPQSPIACDPRIESIVESVLDRCYSEGSFKQALGVALESSRLDHVKRAICESGDVGGMLAHCYKLVRHGVGVITSREFRHQVVRTMVTVYLEQERPDFIAVCQCLLTLNDAKQCAAILDRLINQGQQSTLVAFQVAFELIENENQPFLLEVIDSLPKYEAEEPKAADETAQSSESQSSAVQVEPSVSTRQAKLREILSGACSLDVCLQFLYAHNHTDMLLLGTIKDSIEKKVKGQGRATLHNAVVMAHALMQSGTSVDKFLRSNLDWLRKGTNWAKFAATAGFGVIHKGHHRESLKLLGSYLPGGAGPGSPYQEGGALYALGLIHANLGADKSEYLIEKLNGAAGNEIVQHGAALGLGLTSMATGRADVQEALKNILYQDSAVAGNAAGLAMGIVNLGRGGQGSGAEVIDDMLAYARETKHEKIIRGLAVGLALIMYGREEECEVMVTALLGEADEVLRYGGCYTLGAAYAGTGNNSAIRRLLHVAVSDVSNDVRRAAVTNLGFVLCSTPEEVPKLVKLLAGSFNAGVRYGAAQAIGLSCAATGSKVALDVLWPMLKDRVDYVQQSAMTAIAMVLQQHNEAQEPRVKEFREHLTKTISADHAPNMTRFGAVIAQGILDAGGRNQVISLLSPGGHKRNAAILGMIIFQQYWFWFPLMHCLALTFQTTAVIGLNQDLKIPKNFQFKSDAKPAAFQYPPYLEPEKKTAVEKVKAAELSIAKRAKERKALKLKRQSSLDKTDNETTETKPEDDNKQDKMEVDDNDEKTDDKTVEKSSEGDEKKEAVDENATFVIQSNPSRVTQQQRNAIKTIPDQRYVPVKQKLFGIVMLRDTTPDEEEDLLEQKGIKSLDVTEEEEEPSPPKPFEFLR